jgi:hypothetical protein
MGSLNSYAHDSELQAFRASPLYLYNSQLTTAPTKPFPACCVFTSRSLATASNSGDSSTSRAQILSSQNPLQNSTILTKLQTPLPVITYRLGLHRKYIFIFRTLTSTRRCLYRLATGPYSTICLIKFPA